MRLFVPPLPGAVVLVVQVAGRACCMHIGSHPFQVLQQDSAGSTLSLSLSRVLDRKRSEFSCDRR
jgi:hypothetical protein